MVNTIIVGSGENSAASGGAASGTLNFYGGTIDVNTLTIGQDPAAGPAAINGTVNVHSDNAPAQLTVNNNLRIAMYPGGSAVNGILNVLNNAAVTVKGSIIGGLGNSLINVQNSTFTMGSSMGGAGTGQGPINTFQLYSSTMTIDMGGSPNPVAAVCAVTNLDLQGSSTLALLGSALSVGQFHLLTYATLVSSGAEAFSTVTLPPQIQGYISNNVAANSIDLVITNVIAPVWNGLAKSVANGNWDINTTSNWMSSAGVPLAYHQSSVPGDQVTFDDRANGTTTVNLTTTLAPASISVNTTTKSYTYTGAGQLSGPGGLAKNGGGVLTIANSGANSFTGPVAVGGGKLQLGAANALPTNSAVTLADATGAVLDFHNFNQMLGALSGGGANGGNVSLGTGMLTVAGTGGNYAGVIDGSGALVLTNSGSQVLAGANLYSGGTLVSTGTLAVANASGSGLGSGWVDIEGGILQLGNGTAAGAVSAATITNNGQLTFNRSDDVVFTNVITGSGTVTKMGAGVVTLSVPNSYTGQTTVADGPLRITHPNALGTTNGLTFVPGASPTARLELMGDITVLEPLTLNSKGGALNGNSPAVLNVTGTNVLAGPIQAISAGTDLVIQSDDGKLILSGPFLYVSATSRQQLQLRGAAFGEWHGSIGDAGGSNKVALIKRDSGAWTFTSDSTNTYSDTTTVLGGTLVVNGAILGSSGVTVGSVSSGAGTLSGAGLIVSPVNLIGSALAVGTTPDPGVIGTLTISNNLSFDGGCIAYFDLSRTGAGIANDQVAGLSNVTYAGNLQLNLTGTVKGGEVFKLFSASSYTGAFDNILLPPDPLPAPLAWNTSFLAVDGTVRVDGISLSNPTRLSNGNFQFTIGVPASGAGLPYRVLATTAAATPVSNWVQVGSGTFAGGPFIFTDLNATNYLARFYVVVTP
jgi:fibronectin-binding autotransporter adhesin